MSKVKWLSALALLGVLTACGNPNSIPVSSSEIGAETPFVGLVKLGSPSDISNLPSSVTIDRGIGTIRSTTGLQTQASLDFPPIVPALLPQPCTSHITAPDATHGYITIQQDPVTRTVTSGFFMYAQYKTLYTFWKLRPTRDSTEFATLNKLYEPHASIPGSQLKIGNIVYFQGIATGPNSYTYIQASCRVTQ